MRYPAILKIGQRRHGLMEIQKKDEWSKRHHHRGGVEIWGGEIGIYGGAIGE
jgi:hypothetical protein